MKIDLKGPYSQIYRHGYLREAKKDKRRRVDLYNSKKDRSTIAYARYLVTIEQNRFLENWEEVDHIDGDCSNDSLNNLQILCKKDHMRKTVKERPGKVVLTLTCPYCGSIFERDRRQVVYKNSQRTFCSRSCNGKFYSRKTAF